MSGSLNKVILIGNLGKDPELRHMQDTKKVVSFPVATSESWKDKVSGERKEKTEWHRVVIFNENLCDIAHKFLKKGSKVYLEGQLQTRKWTDKENMERYTTEIVLQQYRGELIILDTRNDPSEYSESPYIAPIQDENNDEGHAVTASYSNINDEVPF